MSEIIEITAALQEKNAVFIDTRSPKEFTEDHIPNAINVPILNNEERAIVGTLYKQVSQEIAIERGMEFFGKNLPSIISAANQQKNKTMIIYCWRGGLRSKTVTSLLESLNYKVRQLKGGYKAYRAHVKEKLEKYHIKPKIVVLYGLTGTGKTELLQKSVNSIDLEAMAGHRGSVYGGIGITQNTQKKFENLLLQKLEELKEEKYILVEGESKRIGDIFIPEIFFKAMENGIKIEIRKPFDERVAFSVATYCNTEEKRKEFLRITKELRKNITNKTKETILDALEKGDATTALATLLKEYYDPLYSHYLDQLKYDATISNAKADDAKKRLQRFLLEKGMML